MTEHNTILYIRGRQRTTEHSTILYISDRANSGNSVLATLQETGCEVVSTNSPAVGVALFYAMHSVDAVMLENRAREQTSFDVVQSLGEIRPNVPVMVLCGDQIDSSPSCVSTDKLTSAIQHLLNAEPVVQ